MNESCKHRSNNGYLLLETWILRSKWNSVFFRHLKHFNYRFYNMILSLSIISCVTNFFWVNWTVRYTEKITKLFVFHLKCVGIVPSQTHSISNTFPCIPRNIHSPTNSPVFYWLFLAGPFHFSYVMVFPLWNSLNQSCRLKKLYNPITL